jgi:putative hydrolase of the HAD superfamily
MIVTIEDILDVEKYIDKVSVIIFDLDDTLYSEKDYVRSGYKKIAEYFHIPDLADEMWKAFKSGGKAIDEALKSVNLLDRRAEALQIYRTQQPDIELYPGVRELLQRIREKKKIAIITDGRPEGQSAKLKALKIQVDKIIITDELGGVEFRKPNETAFRMMQEYFQVPFKQMVYIGDNLRKDFAAPQKLGMRCIYFKNADGLYSIENNCRILKYSI